MDTDYTIEINTKTKALVYREGGKVFCFDMDTHARPMVVYCHEFSDGRSPNWKAPLTDDLRDMILPRLSQYFIKNHVKIKVTCTSLRTLRK